MNSETKFFQWLMGDRQSEICIFDRVEEDDGIIYVCFTDKSRVNEQLVAPLNQQDVVGKMVAEIDNPNNCWKFQEEWIGRQEERWEKNQAQELVCVDPFVPGRKVMKLIPPRRSAPKTSNYGTITNQQPAQQVPVQPTNLTSNIDKSDPIYILINKSKKIDNEIEMSLVVSLPTQSLYNIAKESFEEGDSKFIDYIVSDINTKDIIESLKIAIKNMYENN